jgi:hypothetical protein
MRKKHRGKNELFERFKLGIDQMILVSYSDVDENSNFRETS